LYTVTRSTTACHSFSSNSMGSASISVQFTTHTLNQTKDTHSGVFFIWLRKRALCYRPSGYETDEPSRRRRQTATHDGDWRGAITRRSWLTLRFACYSVASLLTNPASATKNLLGRSSGRFYFFTLRFSPSAEEFFWR
jgi:hypothetical protein